jgi:AraC-like DNA-binding protein
MAIPDKIRNDVLARAGFRCEYCKTYSRLETRFLILERFLLTMMVQPPEQHPIIDFALHEFQKLPMPTVREVTKQIGISPRHFGQLFRDRVGLTPKLFCRVQRLRRVLYLLAIVTITFHDHNQFRIPQKPHIIALTETSKDAVVEVLSQLCDDFKSAREFKIEYEEYLRIQS